MSAGRTLAPTLEENAMRREMNRLQVATMTADLRLHNAQADMAEFTAARAHAELKDYLAQHAALAKHRAALAKKQQKTFRPAAGSHAAHSA